MLPGKIQVSSRVISLLPGKIQNSSVRILTLNRIWFSDFVGDVRVKTEGRKLPQKRRIMGPTQLLWVSIHSSAKKITKMWAIPRCTCSQFVSLERRETFRLLKIFWGFGKSHLLYIHCQKTTTRINHDWNKNWSLDIIPPFTLSLRTEHPLYFRHCH